MPTKPLTKADLIRALRGMREGMRAEMRQNTRDIIDYVRAISLRTDARLDHMDGQFVEVQTKLDAIMSGEGLATRKQLKRLIQALNADGIPVSEAEVFAEPY